MSEHKREEVKQDYGKQILYTPCERTIRMTEREILIWRWKDEPLWFNDLFSNQHMSVCILLFISFCRLPFSLLLCNSISSNMNEWKSALPLIWYIYSSTTGIATHCFISRTFSSLFLIYPPPLLLLLMVWACGMCAFNHKNIRGHVSFYNFVKLKLSIF